MNELIKEVAGIKLPDSPICVAVSSYASKVSEPFLYYHVLRSYVFGAIAGGKLSITYDQELYYIASILHDLGLTDSAPVQSRFEVDGANMASRFLSKEGMSDSDIDIVWDAIALHTSPEFPMAKGPEAALTQMGAALDVGVAPIAMIDGHLVDEVVETFPRLGFKKALEEAMLGLYRRNPKVAAKSHVVAAFCERHIAGFEQPHFCSLLENSNFDE